MTRTGPEILQTMHFQAPMAAAKTHSESSLPVLPRAASESVWAVTVAVAVRPVSAGRGGMAVHGAASTRARARVEDPRPRRSAEAAARGAAPPGP